MCGRKTVLRIRHVNLKTNRNDTKANKPARDSSAALLEESRRLQKQLRHFTQQILVTQEAARTKLSHGLQNEVVQTLAGAQLRLLVLKNEMLGSNRDFKKMIAVTQRLVQTSVDVVHRFACDLRPTVLDDLGLIPALLSQLKDFRKETGIHVDFTSSAGVDKLTPARRTILYRIVQKALLDIARHAGVSHVKVSLLKSRGAICLEIHDNGIGFSVEEADLGKGLLLPAMREQVEMQGGTLDMESGQGKESTVRVRIPQGPARPKKRPLKKNAPLKCP